MAEYIIQEETLIGLADAVRAKSESTGELSPAQLIEKINALSIGIDTSDATAVAGDILSGKTAYVAGSKVTGTIATKTSSNLTASGATVTVPAGYYAANATKSVSTATQATPSISVSSAGLITASATQNAGYVSSGTKSATKQLTTKAATTITPGTSDQSIAAGTYCSGKQTIKGDANLVAANIIKGMSIFGITGTGETGIGDTSLVTGTNISKAATGSKTFSSTSNSGYTFTHNLGVTPKIAMYFTESTASIEGSNKFIGCIAFANTTDVESPTESGVWINVSFYTTTNSIYYWLESTSIGNLGSPGLEIQPVNSHYSHSMYKSSISYGSNTSPGMIYNCTSTSFKVYSAKDGNNYVGHFATGIPYKWLVMG